MDVSSLLKIYTHAKVADSPHSDDSYFNYFDGVKFLHIYKDNLRHEEMLLLKSMMSENTLHTEWYNYLVRGNKFAPEIESKVQCIHFCVKKVNPNKEEWLSNFQSYFFNVIDAFFLNDEYGIILINDHDKSDEELQGFISMLDDDFSTTTSLYIGIVSNIDNFYDVFKEEQSIFQANINGGKVIDFFDTYLPYYIRPQLKDSFIGQEIRKLIDTDDEIINLIKSLWNHQGNLSATADDLFIHRNTINYRIDKLYKEQGLDLRNMQQLLLCYLLTL